MINSWYIPLPPWVQTDQDLNVKGVRMSNASEALCMVREALIFRERLLPYLYTAFAKYVRDGVPPIRAMFFESPEDRRSWECDSQFFLGESLIVAPLTAAVTGRDVFLPEGRWHEFDSGTVHEGGRVIHLTEVPLSTIPIFVRSGSILPLVERGEVLKTKGPRQLEAVAYGEGPCRGELFADDGVTMHRQGPAGQWQAFFSPQSDELVIYSTEGAEESPFLLPKRVKRIAGSKEGSPSA